MIKLGHTARMARYVLPLALVACISLRRRRRARATHACRGVASGLFPHDTLELIRYAESEYLPVLPIPG
jgi:hypothetical protein